MYIGLKVCTHTEEEEKKVSEENQGALGMGAIGGQDKRTERSGSLNDV